VKIVIPCSSYSALVIANCEKEPKQASIEPPIHAPCLLSSGDEFEEISLKAAPLNGGVEDSSRCILVAQLAIKEPPPERIKPLRTSLELAISDFSKVWQIIAGRPGNFRNIESSEDRMFESEKSVNNNSGTDERNVLTAVYQSPIR